MSLLNAVGSMHPRPATPFYRPITLARQVFHMRCVSEEGTLNFQEPAVCRIARRVGKLCVFRRQESGQRLPFGQGTVIQISEDRDYFVTARHVLFPGGARRIDLSQLEVYILLDDRPAIIPWNRSMEESGWIKVDVYRLRQPTETPAVIGVPCPQCPANAMSDFIYLGRQKVDSPPTVSIEYRDLTNQTHVVLLGFFGTDHMDTFRNIQNQIRLPSLAALSEDQRTTLVSFFGDKSSHQKFACFPHDQNVMPRHFCHVYRYCCTSAGGFSGGMVAFDNTTDFYLCAMHVGKDDNLIPLGIGLRAHCFL